MTSHIATTTLTLSFPVTLQEVSDKLAPLRGHSFETPALYKEGVSAIAICRGLRVQVEQRRQLLKEDSLKYGREVDRIAHELTGEIRAVEDGLKAERKKIDDAKEAAKREAAEAERKALEAQLRAQREAEEAELRAVRKQEEAALIAQRKELEAARAELAASRAQAAKEAQELSARAAEEKRLLEEERARHAAELAELRGKREAEERAQAAKELAERLEAEREEQRINQLEYLKAHAKRVEALKPDKDRLTQVARAIRALIAEHDEWTFDSPEASEAYDVALQSLDNVADDLESFAP